MDEEEKEAGVSGLRMRRIEEENGGGWRKLTEEE